MPTATTAPAATSNTSHTGSPLTPAEVAARIAAWTVYAARHPYQGDATPAVDDPAQDSTDWADR